MPLSASALRAAFRRSGAGGSRAGEIESAPQEIAVAIRSALGAVRDADRPVLACWSGADDWVAVAPTEIYVRRSGRLARLSVSDIVEVAPASERRPKTDSTELDVRFATGELVRISADAGPAFVGMWNALLALMRSTKRHP